MQKVMVQENEEKLKSKLLKKLEGFMERPAIEVLDHGTGKRAAIRESFQVLGKLFPIELACEQKLENVSGEAFMKKQYHLIIYNSRSRQGGRYYYALEDIAKALDLEVDDLRPHLARLEELSNMSTKEIEKAKAYYFKKIQKSVTKIEKKAS